jgi:MFS family permease
VLVTLGWVGTFTYAFTFGVIFPFFPLYATDTGVALGLIGGLLAVQSVFNAVARIPMGYLSDRTGRRVPFIVTGLLVMSAGTVACVSTDGLVTLFVIFAALGFSNGTINMAISTSLAEATPPGTRGMAMGGQSTARFAGFAASPLLVGALIPTLGYMYSFSAAALVSVVGAIAYIVLARKAVEPLAGRS